MFFLFSFKFILLRILHNHFTDTTGFELRLRIDSNIFIFSVYTFSVGNPLLCNMKNHHGHPSSNHFILFRTTVVRVQLIAFLVSQIQILIIHCELMTSARSWMNSDQLPFIFITALVHTVCYFSHQIPLAFKKGLNPYLIYSWLSHY